MWEWEDQDDPGGGDAGGMDAAQIIENQKADLERRKEAKKIELEVNDLIDSRINAYKNLVEIGRLELQQTEKFLKDQKEARENAELLRQKMHEAAEQGVTGDAMKELEAAFHAAIAQAEQFSEAQKQVVDKLLDTKVLGSGMKKELQEAFANVEQDPERLAKALAKAQAEFDNIETVTADVSSAFQSLAGSMGITADISDSAFGKMFAGMSRLFVAAKKNPFVFLQVGANALMSMFSPLNLLSQGMGIFKKSLLEAESAAAEMTQAFGGSMTDNMNAMRKAQGEALKYNASLKEVSKSHIALQGTIAGFNRLSDAQASSLRENSMIMGKMGVDEKMLAKETQRLAFAFGGLGAGTEKAQKKIIGLAQAGQDMGYTMAESVQMLSQFGGAVASMGGDITTQMKEMMAMAKATGAEMSKLVSIAKKFNTFKEGADMAAKLNSVFGTSISQIELMGKTAPERNQIIADSLRNATGGYQSMTDHQRLAAAEMLGFGDDVQGLRAYMEGQTEASRMAAEARAKDAANMEKLRETAMTMVPALQQLTNAFNKAFIESGLFQTVSQMLIDNKDTIVSLFMTAARFVEILANNLGLLSVAYLGAKLSTMAYTAAEAMGVTPKVAGTALTYKQVAANFALGNSWIFALGPIGLAVGLLLALMAAFVKKGSPALWEIAGVMAIGVLILGAALYFAGPPIVKVSLALGLLALALVAVFYLIPPIIQAIGGLVDSVTALFSVMIEGVGELFLVATALMAIGGAFFFLGKMAMLASLGIAAGTIALLALRLTMAMSGTSFEDLMSIGEGVSKMGEGMKALKEGISGLASAGGELMKSLGDKSIIVTGDAQGATMVAGKGGMFAMIPPQITVDVNMDDNIEMAAPTVNVSVTLDGDQLRHIVSEEIAKTR